MQHEIIRSVSSGFPLRILVEEGEWSKVEDFAERKGWIANRLLAENNSVVLKTEKGSLQSGPSNDDSIIEQIDYGTIMQIEEVRENWLKVNSKDGVEGWLHRNSIWP